jgi:RHS repeat-associated protein
VTHAKFDYYGNQIESTDAKNNVTTTEYSALYNYAFPTKVTTVAPDPSGQNGSNAGFVTEMTYDSTTGLPLTTKDANGQTTTMEYDAATLRPKKVTPPTGAGISETIYNDAPNNYWVKNRTQIDANNWAEAITYLDGLGRSFKSEKLDSSGSIFTETEFDAVGRPKRSTNPYRNGEAKVWTTTNYDVQGRPFEVVTSDGAKVTTAFGVATTGANIGTVVTVTDQANKQRRSITNALGQLTRVDEPNNAGLLDVNGVPAQPTNYTYDTLNNLVTVVQGVQTRSFAYDSLSRLKSANNPESGLITYAYDNNGNLTSKTDARNVVTNYVYDNLNRVKTRSYSDNTTPNVSYIYDNLTNAKGKLIKVTNGLSETRYLAFDILGQVTSSQQKTDGVEYNPQSYVYNLSGALIEETYPSGRVVRNTLDADGDLAQVQSKKSNGTLQNYANAFTYTSAGAVNSLRLGNGKFENTTFNSRLQPIQIGLGSSATSQNLLKLNFDYGLADNNGNVKSQTITTLTVGNVAGFVATQNYTYDSLNRIKQAEETIPSQTGWKQTFKYDRYGNREFDTQNNNTNTLTNGCPVAVCNPSANPNDNKLVGTNYDSVGNTKVDANGQTFTYDAENKQTKVVNAQGVTLGEYFYDGDGKRIKKIAPLTNETTIFVYDASSKMVAEYSTVTASQSEAKTSYTTNDHLGSPRITTDATGKVISRRDFMPFGEEIARAGNGTDSVRQKFTGYERDGETGLDYAKARMFGSSLGRFTSPDPLSASASPILPQSWNRYTYSYNNPLRFTDPSGMVPGDFYNLDGKKIGTDGVDDKKIHIVLDKDKAKEIEKTTKAGGKFTGAVDSKFTLPNADVVTAIGAAVDRSNSSTFDKSGLPALKSDAKATESASGGFSEAGVSWKTTDGTTTITAAPNGPYSDPRIKGVVTISMPSDSDGDAHIHPSGQIETKDRISSSGGGTTSIGGVIRTPAQFIQPPSAVDIGNAGSRNRIVVGAGDKTVYFYNSSGTMKQTMKLSNFLKIGK